ncbi:hypothetical protein COLO4_20244 [Corchorus olitorius]|uniref:Uncharacterized protein n=1 Tax=Corchorus olitorius TaxID=93759 RepID=A0A1R3J0W4_9ROSI|nr:hypothetical protein COLO4_20244 [Corchorus olitorius]
MPPNPARQKFENTGKSTTDIGVVDISGVLLENAANFLRRFFNRYRRLFSVPIEFSFFLRINSTAFVSDKRRKFVTFLSDKRHKCHKIVALL